MIDGKRILAVIPARGGSKGVPGKNIRMAGGKPLIAWVIQAATKSRYIDRVIVSSDDAKIIDTATAFGCEAPFVRPGELAEDNRPTAGAVKHAVETLPGFDYVVTLQPTSPLTESGDIDDCIRRCVHTGSDACVSVTASDKSPFWMFTFAEDGTLNPVMGPDSLKTRRQDLPRVMVPNGAVYVTKCDFVVQRDTLYADRTLGVEMPKERSIDIDTELDFLFFETLLLKEKKDG